MSKILIIAVCVIAIVVVVFILLDGSFMLKQYKKAWKEDENTNKNDLMKIIDFAIGASSSHNMQPWLVKLADDSTMMLFADTSKELPVVDGDKNQMLMSQGAFIAKFVQGAKKYGYDVKIEYSNLAMDDELPLIATMQITKNGVPIVDTISSSTMVANQTDEISDLQQDIIRLLDGYSDFSHDYIQSGADFDKLQKMLLEGTIIESKNVDATNELLSIFRWTEWDKNKYRYGLSITSLPAMLKPFVQPIMKVSSKNIEAFGESSISMFEDRLANDTGYILIKKENPTNLYYIFAGQIYQELINNSSGYSLRPAVQVLEKFDAMMDLNEEFKNEFGDDGEVLLIITVQIRSNAKVSSNPRHLIEDILLDN